MDKIAVYVLHREICNPCKLSHTFIWLLTPALDFVFKHSDVVNYLVMKLYLINEFDFT